MRSLQGIVNDCLCKNGGKKSRFLVFAPTFAFALVLALSSNGFAQNAAQPALDRIPPGTVITLPGKGNPAAAPAQDFSNIVLFVNGKIGEGDVEAASSTVKFYADLFNLVYLANVKKKGQNFELDKVAVGFSSKINGDNVVVTSQTAKKYGLSLSSLVGEPVLDGNYKALDEIKVIAQNKTSMVFDAPSVMQYKGDHEKMVVRFYLWVSPVDGKLGTCVWLLEKDKQLLAFAENQVHYLKQNMIEDRVMHVDGSKFFLGIPSADAFAIVSLPKGRTYQASPGFLKLGAQNTLNPTELEQLAVELDATFKQPPPQQAPPQQAVGQKPPAR